MIIEKTKDWQRINELFAIAFSLPKTTGPGKPEADHLTYWAACDDSCHMMSALTLTDYTVNFDGHPCRMSGVGGVSTLPQYRGRGGIRGIFEACLPDLYNQGYDFSYLYPFSSAFYRKFGYENCVQKLNMKLDLGRIRPSSATGSCLLCEPGSPMAWEITQLDQLWEQRFNMAVQHGDGPRDWAVKPDPASTLQSTYVYFDGAHRPKAYVTFSTQEQPDGRNLQCSRLVFTDADSFAGIIRLFAGFAYDHRYVKFQLPAGEGMEYLLQEWASGAAHWDVDTAGMVRVINVMSVLRKARYQGTGSLRLGITDPQIPENTGCYEIRYEIGKALSVEKSQEPAEVSMPISSFSALITGAGNPAWMPDVEVHSPNISLSDIFYHKPLMITDFF